MIAGGRELDGRIWDEYPVVSHDRLGLPQPPARTPVDRTGLRAGEAMTPTDQLADVINRWRPRAITGLEPAYADQLFAELDHVLEELRAVLRDTVRAEGA